MTLGKYTASPQTFPPLFANMSIPASSSATTLPMAFADGNIGPVDISAIAVQAFQVSP